MELDPLSIRSLDGLAIVLTMAGRFDESITVLHQALELDPEVSRINGRIGYNHLLLGNMIEAKAEYELEATDWVRDLGKILILRRSLDYDGWTSALDNFIRDYGKKDAYQIAEIYADADDPDAAFGWLESALEVRDPGLIWIKTDALLSSLHEDPRWLGFLNRVFNSG